MGKTSSITVVPETTDVDLKVERTNELDVAAKFLDEYDGDYVYTPEEEKNLVWRLDKRLVPILFFNITLGAADKSTISTAALYGLKTDCNLTIGDRYSWASSAFYFGYLVWSLPSGGLLQRYPIAKTMMISQVLWGITLIGTGFVSTFPAFIAMRALLGFLEAPIAPGNFLVMTMWYTRTEQPLRTGLFYTALSNFITGPIGYGIGCISGSWFSPWRAIYWVIGAITVVYSIILGFVLPDNPLTAKFMGERERMIAITRLRKNQTGIENKTWKWNQFIEAMTDVKTWLMFLLGIFISFPNNCLGSFSTLIMSGLGYSSRSSSLLLMCAGITGTFASYLCNGIVYYCGKKYPHLQVRGIAMITVLLVAMISTVFLYTLPLTAYNRRMTALFMAYFYLGPYPVSVGIVAANTAGHTKKVVLNALVFIAFCVSNIIGPFFFKSSQAPLYPLGMGAMLGSYVLSMAIIGVYMAYCWNENRRRDALNMSGEAHLETDFKDLTDKENIHFRYVW